jgi:virginiamycin B lyase
MMNTKPFVVSSLTALAALGVVGALKRTTSAHPGDVAELKVVIHEYAVPTKGAHPHDPAVGPHDALWFTEQMTNKIGRLDPKTGEFKEYPLPAGENAGPHGLVADREGNIWFTANFGGYIGKLDPNTGKVTEYKMPSEKAGDPHTAVFDAHDILWFTVQGGNMVGRMDPKTGKIELKEVPTESALPYGIQVDSKGIPIFCELGTSKMGSIDPATMKITEYPLPAEVRPRRLAIAHDDTVYFTDFKSGHLGHLNLATGAVKLYDSPSGPESNPYGITITPDGMVWYSESGVKPNTIVRFDPKTETFARAKIPSGGGVIRNMAATSDGRVYIACSGVDKVGVVEPVAQTRAISSQP